MALLAGKIRQQPSRTANDDLHKLVHSAVAHIPDVDYAGITVVSRRGGNVATPTATHEHPRTLDAIQQHHREGPCFAAALEHDTFFINDLRADTRWPLFQLDALAQTPIQSIGSYQLFTTGDTVGALNFYADHTHAMTPESQHLGYIYASHAAIIYAAVHRNQVFDSNLANREVIGQATGMIIERDDLDARMASAYLRLLAQTRGIPVADLARHIVERAPSAGA